MEDVFREKLESLLSAIETGSTEKIQELNAFFRRHGDANRTEIEDRVRVSLRKWRCKSLPNREYQDISNFLKGLTIFSTFEVPLFTDTYGDKRLLSYYSETVVQSIEVLLSTPIIHVTHREEAEGIVKDKKFKPSDDKNIIKGIWFNPKSGRPSIFGRWAFETTLASLGVTGLRQGEIVSYKNQANVILYASTDGSDDVVKVPTVQAACARAKDTSSGYVLISIFVPSKLLPQQGEEFRRVVKDPYKVWHGPFCARQKRSLGMIQECNELNYS